MTFFDSLAVIGLCFIIKYASILNFIRLPLSKIKFFKELLSCTLCIGSHIGFWIAICSGNPSLLDVCSSVCYCSAICWLADHFIMVSQTYLYGRD